MKIVFVVSKTPMKYSGLGDLPGCPKPLVSFSTNELAEEFVKNNTDSEDMIPDNEFKIYPIVLNEGERC